MDHGALRSFVERDVPSDQAFGVPNPVPVPLGQLVAALGDVTGIAPTAVLSASPGTASARQLLSMLAIELRAATTKELADVLGLTSAASVRVLARRGRVRTADDPAFARCRNLVLSMIKTGDAVPGTGVTG